MKARDIRVLLRFSAETNGRHVTCDSESSAIASRASRGPTNNALIFEPVRFASGKRSLAMGYRTSDCTLWFLRRIAEKRVE